MKKTHHYLLLILLWSSLSISLQAQKLRLNGYASYVFQDNIDSYYDQYNYYNGAIKDGLLWGAGIEGMVKSGNAFELSYFNRKTTAPINYYDDGIRYTKFDVTFHYIMLGYNRYFQTMNQRIEPTVGLLAGVSLVDLKNPDNGRSSTPSKFSWGIRGGTNIYLTDVIGVKLQLSLMSVVQAVGGSLYFGTGGSGAGLSAYSSMYQFGIGGGLTLRFKTR